MIYQPSLFAHINRRYHAFKAEVLKDSHCETAHFLARYMYVSQKVLTLIRATRKKTLICMSALSVCLLLNVHCKRSQQLRTIRTCVTDYTHKGPLTVWALYAYFSDSQNAAFELLVWCM